MPAHQESALWYQVDPEIVEGDDVRLVQQQRAAHPRGAVLADGLQTDEVGELARAGATLLDHRDPMSGRDRPRVDRVDALGAEAAEKRRQERGGQHRAVVIGDLAGVVDVDSRRRLPPDLGVETADALGNRDERSQERHGLRKGDGSIEREAGQAAVEDRDHLLGDLECHADLRFLGRGTQVRRRDHLRHRQQRVLPRRLLLEDVDRRAGDLAIAERVP